MAYDALGTGHSISEILDGGALVALEDGSRWQVYEGFVFRSVRWEPGQMITVKPNRDELFPYKLINVHRNEEVEVSLVPE